MFVVLLVLLLFLCVAVLRCCPVLIIVFARKIQCHQSNGAVDASKKRPREGSDSAVLREKTKKNNKASNKRPREGSDSADLREKTKKKDTVGLGLHYVGQSDK